MNEQLSPPLRETDLVELIPKCGIEYFIRHDLRDSDVTLADYVKLHGLRKGDILFLNNGNAIEPLVVGTCTKEFFPGTNGLPPTIPDIHTWQNSEAIERCKWYKVLCVYGMTLHCGSCGFLLETL